MFVDASALVASLTGKAEREAFLVRFERASSKATSAIAIYQASHALARKTSLAVKRACGRVEASVLETGIELSANTGTTGDLAVNASARYGKRSGHPAKLNVGDCSSYALVKSLGITLLYKGDDFARTDLA